MTDFKLARIKDTSVAPSLYSIIERDREYLCQYLPHVFRSSTLDSVIEHVAKSVASDDIISFVITVDEEQTIVGRIDILRINQQERTAEIGYYIAENWQGHGIITRSVNQMVQYAIEHTNLLRLDIICRDDNWKSRCVAERTDFKREENRDFTLNIEDNEVKLVVYSKQIREE
jgi:ribosomal-protein-serine acetyltransferase